MLASEVTYRYISIVHVIEMVAVKVSLTVSPPSEACWLSRFFFCSSFGWRRAPKPVALARSPADVEDGDGPAMGSGPVICIR